MYNLFRFEVTPGKESVKCLARYCFVWNNHFAPVRKKIASSASPPSFPHFLMWEKNKTTTLKSMNQRKPRAIQKTLKILNPLFGQCLDTGFLINFFKAFCFDSAEVQKTMHNSYYPECICQEHWQLGINLRFNW